VNRHALLRGLGAFALVAALLLLARSLVAEPFRIPSASMAPTLKPGDSVLVEKLDPAAAHRGQLVAFHAPRSGDILIKRVVAIAGDRVGIEDGALVVNDRRQHEAYANPKAIDSVYFGPVTVQAGSVFVLGDNRGDSVDSRSFGAVPRRDLIGQVVARIWPPTRWGTPR
jgi:signal peptidase I